ncbi:MAG TPA: hypothetical protein PKM65_05945 [Spirochaetota bacterium]|nr:hypothetical protein [Spirochaetota bacterium]HNT10102.1 hypothetical protein [Spirochaetota bacterium]HNV47627.1 hypothetical protein [Spirochaetota bacterium]HOS39390.1 hypothetical protein [Spirochaetota bacterium]HPI22598.1 hypothetical protein [Spirochaetota bacterium]
MVVLVFILILQVSFAIHIFYMVSYISRKENKDFKGFIVTAVTNIFLGIFVALFILINPEELREINLDRVLLIESGVIFFAMVYIKGKVASRIYRLSQDPRYYHYSYFGKKVLDKSVVTNRDLFLFFLSIPLTLICGAYFVMRLCCAGL